MKKQVMNRQQLAESVGVDPKSLQWFDQSADNIQNDMESLKDFTCCKGVVIDAVTGAPICDAHITLQSNNNIICEAYTDSSGEYDLGVHAGCFKVFISKKDYESKFVKISLRAGCITFFDFALNGKQMNL